MKRVAVSQRVERIPGRQESRDALDQRVGLWLGRAGLHAFPVPNLWPVPDALPDWLLALAPAGVVLSGGEDLKLSPERDATERALLQYAQARGLPVLGLCRGLQMLADFAGAALEPLPGHAGVRHALAGAAGEDLPPEVNSFHHWGLRECPPGFDILARAPDGSIEAIRHRALPWEGWMWHPEREAEFAAAELARVRALFAVRSEEATAPGLAARIPGANA